MSTPATPGVRLSRTPNTPQSGRSSRPPVTPASQNNNNVGTPLNGSQPIQGSGTGDKRSSSIPATPSSGAARRTSRRDLGIGPRILTPRTPSSNAPSSEQSGIQVRAEVWGTTVSINLAHRSLMEFFEKFLGPDGTPLYPALLQEHLDRSDYNLNLNCQNLYQFNPELYRQLLTYPQEIIPIADLCLGELRMKLVNPDNDPELAAALNDSAPIECRPFNLVEKKNMRELNPEDMDTLVAIKGMIIRVGGIVPEMQVAFFRCSLCAHEQEVNIEDGVINEPVQCALCQSRHSYRLVHNRSKFNDKQLIKVQETPDSIPEGETPHSIKVFAFEGLVDFVKPGDRVEITGIYKAVAAKLNPRRSVLSTVYRTYVDAIHFKKTDSSRLQNEANESDAKADVPMTPSQQNNSQLNGFDEGDATKSQVSALEEKILSLSKEPGIYDKLTRSLAPSIWELEDVKKGILCLLFGGSGAEQGAASGKFRGEINVLMCGDPGAAKSQMLQYVHKIAPRGIYTSGKGSSAVGLTASVVKDAETKEMVLESGALVLSDRGVCCIDEFDKMNDATRSILHEVMEQQTVSIAKAGIVCTLNARTSILASANPKESRYNPKLSVVENVQIMPTLLSRFDLIYLVLDQPNEHKDRKLAKHLVGLYYEDVDRASQGDVIDMGTLTAYISFARRTCRPVLSDAAEDLLIEFYTEMRQAGANQKTITATPRQLEALIRLSEALAKMTLSEIVTKEHVYEAKRLMDVATQRAATDPTTGRIDMDLLQTGHSAHERAEVEKLSNSIRDICSNLGAKTIVTSSIYESLVASNMRFSRQLFEEALQQLVSDGFLVKDRTGKVRLA